MNKYGGKFNIGDKVKIRRKVSVGVHYIGLHHSHLLNKEYEITDVNKYLSAPDMQTKINCTYQVNNIDFNLVEEQLEYIKLKIDINDKTVKVINKHIKELNIKV